MTLRSFLKLQYHQIAHLMSEIIQTLSNN